MTRTRLRGLEIGGIQFGIEVPDSCRWEWPEDAISDYTCLPRNPEVHIGLRVASLSESDFGGEVYAFGALRFEVARRDRGWLLGISRRGVREHLASFDGDFRSGEILISEEIARRRSFPLRAPLDEWIAVHRTIARGGLCLNASASAVAGQASLRLGKKAARERSTNGWRTPRAALCGHNTMLVGRDGDGLRCFRTPWSESSDPLLGYSSTVAEVIAVEESAQSFRESLDPIDAADLLVSHAFVPLLDEELMERVLKNARSLAARARVLRLGENRPPECPVEWESLPPKSGLAPPGSSF